MKRLSLIAVIVLGVLTNGSMIYGHDLPARTLPLSGINHNSSLYMPYYFYRIINAGRNLEWATQQNPEFTAEGAHDAVQRLFGNQPGWDLPRIFVSQAGSVYRYNQSRNQYQYLFSTNSNIHSSSITADGKTVVFCSGGAVYMYNLDQPGIFTQLDTSVFFTRYQRAERAELNADGTYMILTMYASTEHEAWHNSYLINTTSWQVIRIGHGSGFFFSPDGSLIVGHVYFPRSLHSRTPDTTCAVYNLKLEPLARFRNFRVGSIIDYSQIPQGFSSLYKHKLIMKWTEFGLYFDIARHIDSNRPPVYETLLIVPGRPDVPEFTNVDNSRDQQNKINTALGIEVDSTEHQVFTVRRYDTDNKQLLWERRFTGSNRFNQIEQAENVFYLFYSRSRYDMETDSIINEHKLRFLDWTTGRQLRKDLVLDRSRNNSRVLFTAPEMEYLILGGRVHGNYLFFWPDKDLLRDSTGCHTYSGPGKTQIENSFLGSISYVQDGKTRYLPAFPEQSGAPVHIAVHPDQHLMAIIDEAGQFFIREISTGRILFRDSLIDRNNRIELTNSITGNDLRRIYSAPVSSWQGFDPPFTLKIQDLEIMMEHSLYY